jgi:hypothetical protein
MRFGRYMGIAAAGILVHLPNLTKNIGEKSSFSHHPKEKAYGHDQ